jgi:RHS Repeat
MTREAEGLKGAVQTVRTASSNIQKDYTGSKYVETSTTVETVAYDRRGRRVEEYSGDRNDDGSNKGKKIFVYDANDRLREVLIYDYQGSVKDRAAYSYDRRGRLAQIASSGEFNPMPFIGSGSHVETRARFIYTASGVRMEETMGGSGKQTPFALFKTVAVYDRRWNITKVDLYLAGPLVSRRTFVYDAEGNLVRMREVNPSQRTFAEESYSYDTRGNLAEVERHSGPPRSLERKTFLSYEFDAAGNWIKKSSSDWVPTGKGLFQKGVSPLVPRQITQRHITYYDQPDAVHLKTTCTRPRDSATPKLNGPAQRMMPNEIEI